MTIVGLHSAPTPVDFHLMRSFDGILSEGLTDPEDLQPTVSGKFSPIEEQELRVPMASILIVNLNVQCRAKTLWHPRAKPVYSALECPKVSTHDTLSQDRRFG